MTGVNLSAAAAPLSLGVSLFDGGIGRIQGLGSTFVRYKSVVKIGSLPSWMILQRRWRSNGLSRLKLL